MTILRLRWTDATYMPLFLTLISSRARRACSTSSLLLKTANSTGCTGFSSNLNGSVCYMLCTLCVNTRSKDSPSSGTKSKANKCLRPWNTSFGGKVTQCSNDLRRESSREAIGAVPGSNRQNVHHSIYMIARITKVTVVFGCKASLKPTPSLTLSFCFSPGPLFQFQHSPNLQISWT